LQKKHWSFLRSFRLVSFMDPKKERWWHENVLFHSIIQSRTSASIELNLT
jgi:hypothetical protein